jgi:hypothetical protein
VDAQTDTPIDSLFNDDENTADVMQHRMRNDRVTINGELGFVLKEAELST